MRLRSLVAGVVFTMFSAGIVSAAGMDGANEHASKFSDQSLIYFSAPDLKKTRTLFQETALGKIWNEKEMQSFMKEPLQKMNFFLGIADSILAAQKSELRTGDLFSLFEERVSFGLTLSAEEKVTTFKLVISLQDGAAASSLRDRIIKELKSKLPPRMVDKWTLTSDGPSILRLPRFNIALKTDGSDMALTGGNNERKALSQLALSGEGSLATLDSYKAAIKRLTGHRDAFFFLNTAVGWKMMDTIAKNNRQLAQAQPVLKGLGLLGLEAYAQTISCTPPGFRKEGWMKFSGPRSGFFSLFKKGAVSSELLNAVPATTMSMSTAHLDLSGLSKVLRSAITAGKVPEEQINAMLAMGTETLGFDPEADLLNQLGSEVLCVTLDPDTVGGVPFLGLNALAGAVAVKDGDVVVASISKLMSLLSAKLKESDFDSGFFNTEMDGVEVRGLRIVNVFTPCFGLKGGNLFFATGPQALKQMLSAAAGKESRLVDSEDYKASVKNTAVTDGFSTCFTARPRFSLASGGLSGLSSMSMMAGMLLPALQKARQAAHGAGRPGSKDPFSALLGGMDPKVKRAAKEILSTFHLYKLPSANSINQHLFAGGGAGQVFENEILWVSHSPLPINMQSAISAPSVSTAAIIAAIAIPNFMAAKDEANEANAIGSLKSIGTAMEIYRSNNYSFDNNKEAKQYASSFRKLGGSMADKNASGKSLRLIPPTIADAVSPQTAIQGYYFIDIKEDADGTPYNPKFGWGVCAVPAVYGKTGTNTYTIDVSGVVRMSDTGGKPVTKIHPDWTTP